MNDDDDKNQLHAASYSDGEQSSVNLSSAVLDLNSSSANSSTSSSSKTSVIFHLPKVLLPLLKHLIPTVHLQILCFSISVF